LEAFLAERKTHMNIKKDTIRTNGFTVPSVLIKPADSLGTVIIIHGYGGSKEEQLGLGWRISDAGFTSCLIDLPGHGENLDYFDGDIKLYVDSVTKYYQNKGKTAVIGHSVGGRLSLTSQADYVIGISPTLVKDFGNETKGFIKNIRSYRVRELDNDFLWTLHGQLPLFELTERKNAIILFGTRDVPEIAGACRRIQKESDIVFEIDKAFHNDIYLNEKVFTIITNQLIQWIKSNGS
jgi:Serine aminopeptidase, S33